MELPENTGMNEHVIKLIDEKQLFYRSIYAFSMVELETLQVYIKTHLRTKFIQPSKSFANAFILFDKNLDSQFCPCVDY